MAVRGRNVVSEYKEANTVEEVVITVAEEEVTSTVADVVDTELEMKTKMDLLWKQETNLNQEEEVAEVDIVVIVVESVAESAVENAAESAVETEELNEESTAEIAEETDVEEIVLRLRELLSQLNNNSNHINE